MPKASVKRLIDSRKDKLIEFVLDIEKYYHPDEFRELETIAKSKDFLLVSSSPMTRSSYHADEDFFKLQKNRINQTNAQSIS